MTCEVIALCGFGGTDYYAVGKTVVYEGKEEGGMGFGVKRGGVGGEDVGHGK